VTWRAGGTIVTCLVAWLIIGRLDLAAQLGLLDSLLKIGAFYIHERIWNKLKFGRLKPPEYHI